jgi:hypothetical protein
MSYSPFRILGCLTSVVCVPLSILVVWALTMGGYRLEDPEIQEAGIYVRSFKYYEPEAAREVGKECKAALTQSGWTRAGAMELFACIRNKGEARGYYFDSAVEE